MKTDQHCRYGVRIWRMGSKLKLCTGTGACTDPDLFHLQEYGIRIGFGFMKGGKWTHGKYTKILKRVPTWRGKYFFPKSNAICSTVNKTKGNGQGCWKLICNFKLNDTSKIVWLWRTWIHKKYINISLAFLFPWHSSRLKKKVWLGELFY